MRLGCHARRTGGGPRLGVGLRFRLWLRIRIGFRLRLCAQRLASLGFAVERHAYATGVNVVGVLLAPTLAAVGAVAALVSEATVVVEKSEPT